MINRLNMKMMQPSISKFRGNHPFIYFPPLSPIQHHKSQLLKPQQRTLQIRAVAKNMEVEVKLRLPDAHSHQKLTAILSPFHTKTHHQHNLFFDSPDSELAANLAALRLRFYDLDSKCILSLKAKPVISSGISRVEEQEEAMDPSLGRACVAEPGRLLSVNKSKIVERVREEFGASGLVCLGGFKNVRRVYDWNGLILEVDETGYDFGTCYEVECESVEPEKDKKLIEDLFMENGIGYSYSHVSKFAIFRSGKLPQIYSY